MAAISTTDVWAIGQWHGDSAPYFKPLILHWDGTSWTRSPIQLERDAYLNGVVAFASDDVWATGSYFRRVYNRPLLLHWNGTEWRRKWVPGGFESHQEDDYVSAVDGDSSDDMWGVGLLAPREDPEPGRGGTVPVPVPKGEPLAIHGVGKSWTRSAIPKVRAQHSGLGDVFAVDSNDVWAVGASGRDILTLKRTLAFHWDGSAWRRVSTPNPSDKRNSLSGIDGAAPNDVWAVWASGPSGRSRTLISHWDGSSWSLVESPNPSRLNGLSDVSVIAPADAIAVGRRGRHGRTTHSSSSYRTELTKPLALRWDGNSWSSVVVEVPDAGDEKRFYAIDALESGEAWAVGSFTPSLNRRETMIQRLC